VFHRGKHWFVLTTPQAGVVVHIRQTVADAMDRSRSGWFLARAVRSLTGGKVEADLTPKITYSKAAVDDFIGEIRSQTDLEPKDAKVTPSSVGLSVAGGSEGAELAVRWLRSELERALVRPTAPRRFRLPVRRLEPKLTIAKLREKYPSYITVDRGNYTLRVFQQLKPARSYTIAVGQVGLETPAGVYHIQDKQVNPPWHVPNSAWAGDLAGQVIPPGPDDPLKARWMGIFAGAGIHGTEDIGSLGSAASHGCIRMSIPDVVDLYDRVEVGTPIYIG
jgi:lipoprotein-anchoring transpeptidase ErfK/SrfK